MATLGECLKDDRLWWLTSLESALRRDDAKEVAKALRELRRLGVSLALAEDKDGESRESQS